MATLNQHVAALQVGIAALNIQLNGQARAPASGMAAHASDDAMPISASHIDHLASQSGISSDAMRRRLQMAALTLNVPEGAVIKTAEKATVMDANEIASQARKLMEERQSDGGHLNAAQAVALVMEQNKV